MAGWGLILDDLEGQRLFHESWVAVTQSSIIAVMGALGWVLHQWDPKKKISNAEMARGCLLAAFVGSVSGIFLYDAGVSVGATVSISALMGASGQEGLRWILNTLKKKLGE